MSPSSRMQKVFGKARFKASQVLNRLSIRLQALDREQADNTKSAREPETDQGSVAIVITTFDARLLTYCLPLIRGIRAGGVGVPIVVIINGTVQGEPNSRRMFLQAVAEDPGIFPTSLRVMVGLSRMWNLGIQFASTKTCIVLNDDLLVDSKHVQSDVQALAQGAREHELVVGNHSWSHFAISRDCIQSVGWFEERLLGFGEEDGDYTLRFREVFDRLPMNISLAAFVNVVADDRQTVPAGRGKYSLQNHVFFQRKFDLGEYENALTSHGAIDRRLPDLDAYPAENFRWKHQERLLGTDSQDSLEEFLGEIFDE